MTDEPEAEHIFLDDKLASTSTDVQSTIGNGSADVTILARSCSSHSTSSRCSCCNTKHAKWSMRSPLKVPPPMRKRPDIDRFGHPIINNRKLDETLWNKRHHLGGSENELKPKLLRDYFSAPKSLEELRDHLEDMIVAEKVQLFQASMGSKQEVTVKSSKALIELLAKFEELKGESGEPNSGFLRLKTDIIANNREKVARGTRLAGYRADAAKEMSTPVTFLLGQGSQKQEVTVTGEKEVSEMLASFDKFEDLIRESGEIPEPNSGFLCLNATDVVDNKNEPVARGTRLAGCRAEETRVFSVSDLQKIKLPVTFLFSRGEPTTSTLRVTQKILHTMSLPEINDRKASFITPDTAPPLVPIRHVVGGVMKDRDGLQRLWNDRWHKSIANMNDGCHPDHRAYFTQNSLFEDSQSQRWRRYLDQKTYEFNRELAEPHDTGLQCSKPWNNPEGQAIVLKVRKESWAMKQGIQEGAMIISINSKPVASLDEEAFAAAWRHRPLILAIKQDDPVWTTIQCKKAHRFPPLGCRMHGRSGTPIPGATE